MVKLFIDFSHADLLKKEPSVIRLKRKRKCLKDTSVQTDLARYGCSCSMATRLVWILLLLCGDFLKCFLFETHRLVSAALERKICGSPAAGRPAPTRCHRPWSAAWRPNVNIDFTVWRSGECVWDGYVHSGGPRPKFQTREIPSRTTNESVHSFTLLKHDQSKRMRAFPTEETETDTHQMFDWE